MAARAPECPHRPPRSGGRTTPARTDAGAGGSQPSASARVQAHRTDDVYAIVQRSLRTVHRTFMTKLARIPFGAAPFLAQERDSRTRTCFEDVHSSRSSRRAVRVAGRPG